MEKLDIIAEGKVARCCFWFWKSLFFGNLQVYKQTKSADFSYRANILSTIGY